MYLLQRFSSLSTTTQQVTDAASPQPDSLFGVLANATNRSRHVRKGRHLTLSLPATVTKASPTVGLSNANAIVSAEGSVSTLELRLPSLSPCDLHLLGTAASAASQSTSTGARPSSVPFPSSAPISLSRPSKFDEDMDIDTDMDIDFGPFEFRDAETLNIARDADQWAGASNANANTNACRKRAKSCLSPPSPPSPSYAFPDVADSLSFHNSGEVCGYGSDTEAPVVSVPVRKRRLAHSLKRGGGACKKPSAAASQRKERGVRRPGGAVDVHFVALMHRSVAFQLQRCVAQDSHSRSSSGMSDSEAYAGIARPGDENEDVRMGEVDEVLNQDRILVSRLARILAEQGVQPSHSKLSPPHELMGAIELAPPRRPLRLPAIHPPPTIPLPPLPVPAGAGIGAHSPGCPKPAEAMEGIEFAVPPAASSSCPDEQSDIAFPPSPPPSPSSLPSPPLPHVLTFPSPSHRRPPPLRLPSSPPLPSPPTTPSPTRPSHKRRHSQGDDFVLQMPQLVAALTLRFRDRAAARPRARGASGVRCGRVMGSSPSPLRVVVEVGVLELES